MLASQSKAKLLAAPRILVSDNKEANINVGEQVPIVTSSTTTPNTSGTGNSVTSTIQYKDVGIILKVKPRINEGGLVSLEITQEISSYSLQDVSASGTTTEKGIVVSKTSAQTSLVVQNGQTIMIGGLIREDVSDGKSGIPLLNRIPILGYLFGNTTITNHRKELIILLTPRVVTNQAEAQSVTSGYVDTITETGKGKITREELLREQKPKAPDNGTSK
jgi:general secretion pathway protein D